jgi:tRNA G10  N-methylase Trm11
LGYITKRIILIGAFIIISFVFLISGNKIFLFGVLVLTLLVAEIISLIMAFKLKTLFIELKENYFYNSENKITVHAKHISEIDYRHDIFYITLKNNKSELIDTKRFNKNEQDQFSDEFKNWIKSNQIAVGEELKKNI